ncbi:unnamed protein product [Calypogeia fissa]
MDVQPNANIISSSIARIMQFLTAVVNLLTGSTWDSRNSGPSPTAVQQPAPKLPAVTLDEAKQLINPMSRPLAEIANTIASNLAKINQCLEILDKANNDEDRLKACLYRDVEVLKTTKLSNPRTVCTAKSCISEVNGVVEYSAICHDNCGLSGVPHDTIGHPGLKGCTCMDSSHHCNVGKCRCSWQVHQHITYSTRREVEKVRDASVQQQIDDRSSVKAIVQSTLTNLAKEVEELEDEKNKIGTASAQLTVFLKEHALDGVFIDMIDQFLESMIEHRRQVDQMDTCKELEKLRKEYQEEMQLLEKTLQDERAERELLEKNLQEQKELLEKKQAMASSNSSSSPSWTGRLSGLWNTESAPPSKPLNSGQPAAAPPKSFFNGLANLKPLSGLKKSEPLPPKPFTRQPATPPNSFFGGLANLNPFSKSEPASPPARPLTLENVPMLLAELEKLPRSGTSLVEQLQAQK